MGKPLSDFIRGFLGLHAVAYMRRVKTVAASLLRVAMKTAATRRRRIVVDSGSTKWVNDRYEDKLYDDRLVRQPDSPKDELQRSTTTSSLCHPTGMKIDRYILCRPEGGLNDVLCQIERVCRYAEKFDRTAIIDTNHHCTGSIKDHFSRYFVSRQKRVLLDLTAIQFELKSGSVFPTCASDLFHYVSCFDIALGCFVEKNGRLPITFDFTKDYSEPLLVHHCCGRLRGASVAALSRLRLHDNLSDELIKRLNSIGSNYISVHIRNTDYKTNYRPLLNQLSSHPALRGCKNLFVATDDIACLEACRNKLPGFNIFSFSELPHESGRPMHWLKECDDVYQRNKDAILDLLMLALSQKFIFFELNQIRWGERYSGFSELALDLRNSKTILTELISRPDIDMPSWLLTGSQTG